MQIPSIHYAKSGKMALEVKFFTKSSGFYSTVTYKRDDKGLLYLYGSYTDTAEKIEEFLANN